MNVYVSLYLALLFVVLTPGILLTIPRKGPKLTVAVVHGLVFALVYYFTHSFVWQLTAGMEGFSAFLTAQRHTAQANAEAANKAAAEAANKAAAEAANKAAAEAAKKAAAAEAANKAAAEAANKAAAAAMNVSNTAFANVWNRKVW
jgi:pyruvate/2-oxoglutarate dehydrogenase complex dihydrolipoamide acyltransferase (E2) component